MLNGSGHLPNVSINNMTDRIGLRFREIFSNKALEVQEWKVYAYTI